jgi:hypothetical protein
MYIIVFAFTLLLWGISPLFGFSENPSSVLVIGGGPAGLATAIEASVNGAHVIIIEKRNSYSRLQRVFLLDSSIKLLEKWKVDVPEMTVADFGDNGKFSFVSINRLEEALVTQVASHDISSEERFFPGFPRRFFAYFTQVCRKIALKILNKIATSSETP